MYETSRLGTIGEVIISTKDSPQVMQPPIEGLVHYLITPFERPLTRKDVTDFISRIAAPTQEIYPQTISERTVTDLRALSYAYTKEVIPTVGITNSTLYFLLKEVEALSPNSRWEITMFPDTNVTITEVS